MLQERRVIFILILLTLFYVDNIYLLVSTARVAFPIVVCAYISLDFIGGYFPRKVSLAVMIIVVLLLIWNIFNFTFLMKDCQERKLKWGIFGNGSVIVPLND